MNTITLHGESIPQHNLTLNGWGVSFLVETELQAYKAAYIYRNSPHGSKVEHAPNVGMWLVTVWNEHAAPMGCDV